MPTYDYKCNICNTIIELFVWRGNGNENNQFCKTCNQKLVLTFSTTTTKPIFKGSGFYETDYKGKKN